jgi:alcohol dehydrogenase class IV
VEYQDCFGFAIAREIVFGNGSIKYLPNILTDKLKVTKPLLISDQGVAAAGHLDMIIDDLREKQIPFEKFDKVEQEPSIENVLLCVEKSDSKGCDSVVAVGGGSVIDLAKAASVLLRYGGNIRDYLGQENVPGEVLPLVAVSTTAGTGSEVSASAILTDTQSETKVGVRSNYLRPRIALFDPILTLSCPKSVTAATGFDVLSHAVESYTMIDHTCMPEGTVIFYGTNPITEPLAISAIKLVSQNLRTAVHQGHNREAREKMMMANILAGSAFSNSGVTHAHFISYPVGAKTHAPHGVLLATLLPAVLEFNLPTCMDRLAHVATLMGEKTEHLSLKDAAKKGVDTIRGLIKDIQLPSSLREIGLKKEDIPGLAEIAMPILESLPGNPRVTSLEDLIDIYNYAY